MIKLTRENEAITSFQHFKIWGFILTMRNVNVDKAALSVNKLFSFILTMRNVNQRQILKYGQNGQSFILTMRNVNFISSLFIYCSTSVLY